MFVATGNPAATNDIRAATRDAPTSMASLVAENHVEQIKADAHVVEPLGAGIAGASNDLIALTMANVFSR